MNSDDLEGHLKVGDIVMVMKGEQFPADLVLLASSLRSVSSFFVCDDNSFLCILTNYTFSNGKCFVMTANLDGETNLKPLFASK